VKQTVEDADILIVHGTIDIPNSTKFDVMVGEDTALLILLSALAPSFCANIYLSSKKMETISCSWLFLSNNFRNFIFLCLKNAKLYHIH